MNPERWQLVGQIYHEALAWDTDAQVAFLDRACEGDPDLRREVESLLARSSDASAFLETPVLELASRVLASEPPALSVGDCFEHYEIRAFIGSGGMGEVFRAYDTRLHRDVAIKCLPDSITAVPSARARLEREARLLATLNHPNIGAIHGVAEAGGVMGLVLEFVDGPTLNEASGKGELAETMTIARQIADGLEAAHAKGIIHRDLKPANIKVTAGGVVKILDFGLAKVIGDGAPGEDGTNPLRTHAGAVLGTAAYMSPEQARGKPLDQRADIWAFGCVLYELLTGHAAFGAETPSHCLVKVLESEPDWTLLPRETPPSVRRLLRRCLAKDVCARLKDIGDARLEIADALAPEASEPASRAAVRGDRSVWLGTPLLAPSLNTFGGWKATAAAVAVTAAAAAWWWWPVIRPTPAARAVMRLDVDLGVPLSRSQAGPDVGISPNGERLVFMANGRLFTRRLDQSTSVALEGTDGALSFFFSPDSQSLAFFANGKLKRISLDGGSVVTICDAPAGRGGTWGDDEVIVAALGKLEALSRVPAAGGVPATLTRLAGDEVTHRWPQRMPGRNALLFTSHTRPTGFDKARIDVLSLADGRRSTLVEHASFGRYIQAADGTDYVVFRRGASIFAAALDPDQLQVRGAPFPILEQVASSDAFGFASFDTSRTGTWVYRAEDQATVNWLDSSDAVRPLLPEPRAYEWLQLSHGGGQLAFVLGGDVWVHDLGRETRTRLVSDASAPLWTPDDRFIVFQHPQGLSWVRSDGGTPPQMLTRTNRVHMPLSFSSDGQLLSFQELNASGQQAWNLWTVPVQIGDSAVRASTPQPYLVTAFDEREITFSADGRWVAYSSDDSGRREIYVRAFPDDGRKWQVSTAGGTYPQWTRVRQQLFFQAADGLIMIAPYAVNAGQFVPMKPRVWSHQPLDNRSEIRYFSVAADGSRVAAIVRFVPPGQRPDRSVTLLINALDQFGRHMSARRARLPALLGRESQ